MNRRTFFKRAAATCAGVAAIAVAPAVVQGGEADSAAWWSFPHFIRNHVPMLLGKNTSIFIDGDSNAWGVRCIKEGHAYTWQFTIHREEFRRNSQLQRRFLVDAKVADMLKDRREVTGDKYW